MRWTLGTLLICFVLMSFLIVAQQTPTSESASGTVACRALQAYTDTDLKVMVIVFHQRNQAQQSQLAALLHDHSGQMVEVQSGDGRWQQARMMRLGSCFGRGLLLLRASSEIAEPSDFMLRLPAASAAH